MTSTTNPNIVVKNVEKLIGGTFCPTIPLSEKMEIIGEYVNPTKYTIVGMVNRTNDVVLQTRFHNVRDTKGRFATVRRARR